MKLSLGFPAASLETVVTQFQAAQCQPDSAVRAIHHQTASEGSFADLPAAVDPRLARERVHPGNADIDDGLRFATGFFFLITLTVAALSVGRLGPFFNAAISLRHGALVVYGLSGSLQCSTGHLGRFNVSLCRRLWCWHSPDSHFHG